MHFAMFQLKLHLRRDYQKIMCGYNLVLRTLKCLNLVILIERLIFGTRYLAVFLPQILLIFLKCHSANTYLNVLHQDLK